MFVPITSLVGRVTGTNQIEVNLGECFGPASASGPDTGTDGMKAQDGAGGDNHPVEILLVRFSERV
jgi:hypothetical protein